MCLSIALTAVRYNASIANYVEAVEILKGKPYPKALSCAEKLGEKKSVSEEPQTVVTGARVRDRLSGKEFVIRARCVINATGPYTDALRQMDDAKQAPICQPSSGVHIILPGYYRYASRGNFSLIYVTVTLPLYTRVLNADSIRKTKSSCISTVRVIQSFI